MLGILRKYKQSIIIKIIFGLIVFSFIGTIFLIWGQGEDKWKKGSSGTAGTVDRTRIPYETFMQEYYRLRAIYQQLYGQRLTPEMEKQMGLKKMAIDSLIDQTIILKEAHALGLSVSKDEVVAAIAAIPAFQRNGTFDFQQYQLALRSNRLTAEMFEQSQKDEILIEKARQTVRSKVTVTDNDLLQAFKKQNDKVILQNVSFSPSDVKKDITVNDQELQTYLQNHQNDFRTSEQVKISYTLLDPATVMSKLSVSDEEMQTFYQKNIDRYQGKGGILPLAEVKDQVKTDTLKFKAAKQAYEMAADALNKNRTPANLAAAAKSLGSTVTESPLFAAQNPPAALAPEKELIKQVFLLKQGELGGPVETTRGIYLFMVREKKAAAVPPLAEIRDAVKTRTIEEKAGQLARSRAAEALTSMASTSTTLKLQETPAFGYTPAGTIPAIGVSPEMMEAAFALTAQAPAARTPFKIGDRWYAIRLKTRIDANLADFQPKKEQLRQSILPKKQEEALTAWLKKLKGQAKIEINPSILAD